MMLLVLLGVGVFVQSAYCDSGAFALLLQQTPFRAGLVTPDIGIHHFAPNSQISLTAVPQPGYEFVSWLGDVSNPKANTTTVLLNGPKIIIAVFEPIDSDYMAKPEALPACGGGGGGGGMMPAAGDYARQGFSGSGGIIKGQKPSTIKFTYDVTPTIPEPATLLLLGIGGAILLRRR